MKGPFDTHRPVLFYIATLTNKSTYAKIVHYFRLNLTLSRAGNSSICANK